MVAGVQGGLGSFICAVLEVGMQIGSHMYGGFHFLESSRHLIASVTIYTSKRLERDVRRV